MEDDERRNKNLRTKKEDATSSFLISFGCDAWHYNRSIIFFKWLLLSRLLEILSKTFYLKKRTKTHIIDIIVVVDNIETQAYRLSLSKSNL